MTAGHYRASKRPPPRKLWRQSVAAADGRISDLAGTLALVADSDSVGGFVDFTALAAVLHVDESDLFAALDELETARLVAVKPDGFILRRYGTNASQ